MLVTWNCKHLANANKTGHIRRVNALLPENTEENELLLVLQSLSSDGGNGICRSCRSLEMFWDAISTKFRP
jgi:hypothetical protein